MNFSGLQKGTSSELRMNSSGLQKGNSSGLGTSSGGWIGCQEHVSYQYNMIAGTRTIRQLLRTVHEGEKQ